MLWASYGGKQTKKHSPSVFAAEMKTHIPIVLIQEVYRKNDEPPS